MVEGHCFSSPPFFDTHEVYLMVHYIRLLRTPQIGELTKKTFNVSAVAAVTTDLGDAFFAQDLTLIARIVDADNHGKILSAQDVQWQIGSRAVKINLSCSHKNASKFVCLHITSKDTMTSLAGAEMPAILDVWSAAFMLKGEQRAESLVKRCLPLNGTSKICVWEETGDSIARHIWDASLGFLHYFQQCETKSKLTPLPILQGVLNGQNPSPMKVLELGSGCGIVGLALAQYRKCELVLTDLDDAQEILWRNIDWAKPCKGSTVRRQVLGWGPSLENLSSSKFDLVLVSDCIYNPESSVLLVETLEQLSKRNPNLIILVGFKRRHDADDIFFKRMQQSEFEVAEECKLSLPHIMTDHDASEPVIEMFVYRHPS